MMRVTIAYPNGQRDEALLVDRPYVGEAIRLEDTEAQGPSLVVEAVVHIAGFNSTKPALLVFVRERADGPGV